MHVGSDGRRQIHARKSAMVETMKPHKTVHHMQFPQKRAERMHGVSLGVWE